MASASYTLFAFFVLALASLRLSHCAVVKGKVTCLDCNLHYDLSGIKVMVKCDKVQKVATATTEANGAFETELPLSEAKKPVNCLAKLQGGTSQMYVRKKDMVSKVVHGPVVGSDSYTVSPSLAFYTACPSCNPSHQIGSSKTIDLPLPREWGLAPSSYYVPFFPIIGIP